MKHLTSVFFIIMAALVISTTQQQNKSENINDILDELIKQTESGSQNDHREINKSHKAEKSNNNSKIIYFKPSELPRYSDTSNSPEFNIRSIDENNEVLKENGDVIQSHEIELQIEDAIEEDKTVEHLNNVARSGAPMDYIDQNLSTQVTLNKPESTVDENSFYPEILLKDHSKYAESRNIIKNLLSDLGVFDAEEERSVRNKDKSDIELEAILEQLFKNYAIEEVLPSLDMMKIDRVPTLEELIAQYEYLNQQIAYVEKVQEPINVYPNPIGVPAMLPLTPTVVRTLIHHPPPQVLYPPSPTILGNQFATGQRCCRLH